MNMVVLMSLNKSSNSVAITRSVCYNVKASAGAETPNGAMVAKESTIGVKEACEACRGWGHTSSPETEAGFCKPPPFTAREEHSADGLQCHITRYPHAKGLMILQVPPKADLVQPGVAGSSACQIFLHPKKCWRRGRRWWRRRRQSRGRRHWRRRVRTAQLHCHHPGRGWCFSYLRNVGNGCPHRGADDAAGVPKGRSRPAWGSRVISVPNIPPP